jgi:hypothetical protein
MCAPMNTAVSHDLLDSALKRSRSDAQSLRGHADAAAIQRGHGDSEALAGAAEHIGLGHLAVLEGDGGGGGAADTQLVLLLAQHHAGALHVHDEARDPLVLQALVGGGEHHSVGCLPGVGDPGFAAVQHEVVALLGGGDRGSTCITAVSRLRKHKATYLLTRSALNFCEKS